MRILITKLNLIIRNLFVYIFIIFLSACTKGYQHHELVEENLNTYLVKTSNKPKLKSILTKKSDDCSFDFIGNSNNKLFTNCIQQEEINYIESINDGEWPPKLGLALSGGGTRAASFGIGVLKALNETETLKDVDIISSVSGGSYASYWFYSQLFYKDKIQTQLKNKIDIKNEDIKTENKKVIPDEHILKSLEIEKKSLEEIKDRLNYSRDDLFRSWNDLNEGIKQTNLEDPNNYRFQRMLEESSDILAYTHKPSFWNNLTIGMQYAFEVVYQSLTIPFHWIAGGFFDWEINMTPAFYFYKDGLERTYGYVPLDYSLEHFANSKSNSIKGKVDANPILLHEMSIFLNGCDFRKITINDKEELENKINEFNSEFKQKRKECAFLVIHSIATPDKWFISFFNKKGIIETKEINNLSSKLSIALNNTPINNNEVIKLIIEKYGLPLRQKIPSFIINATARYGAEYGEYNRVGGRTMENSVFEFTPWGCYSPLLYRETAAIDEKLKDVKKNKNVTFNCPEDLRYNAPRGFHDLDLARIVTISGAAVDGQVQSIDIGGKVENDFTFWGKSGLDLALDITNLNMGYHVTNPNSNSLNNFAHRLLPWPLYLLHDNFSKESPTSLYLTDGGFSDNLGLFPLIRRGVENIIVVDAEQDGRSIFESAKRINKTLNKYDLQLNFIKNQIINVQDTSIENAVFFGAINGKSIPKEINIAYIKLAAPSRHEQGNTVHDDQQLPFSVRSYMEKNSGFPHQSTADVFYSVDQFRAYRDLGYIVTKICFESKGECKNFYKPQ